MKMAILDGEAVVLDDKGRSDFGMLQRALGIVGESRRQKVRSRHDRRSPCCRNRLDTGPGSYSPRRAEQELGAESIAEDEQFKRLSNISRGPVVATA